MPFGHTRVRGPSVLDEAERPSRPEHSARLGKGRNRIRMLHKR
jgi:hypothetical protein